jgi:hypothetical protein
MSDAQIDRLKAERALIVPEPAGGPPMANVKAEKVD